MNLTKNLLIAGAAGLVAASALAARKGYSCLYCGLRYQTIRALTAADCLRHPDGRHRHELYQGPDKESYECRYCGHEADDIRTLTASKCSRHPKGAYRGRHVPAL